MNYCTVADTLNRLTDWVSNKIILITLFPAEFRVKIIIIIVVFRKQKKSNLKILLRILERASAYFVDVIHTHHCTLMYCDTTYYNIELIFLHI